MSHRSPTKKRHASMVGCFSDGLCNTVDVEAEQMKRLHFVAHSRHPAVFKDVSHNFWSFSNTSLSTQPKWLQLEEERRVATRAWSCRAEHRALWFGMHQPENRNFAPLKTQTWAHFWVHILPISGRAWTSLREQSKSSAWSSWGLWYSLWHSALCTCDRVSEANHGFYSRLDLGWFNEIKSDVGFLILLVVCRQRSLHSNVSSSINISDQPQ